ncbi:stress response protein rds1p-like protein [Apiospora arundinis]
MRSTLFFSACLQLMVMNRGMATPVPEDTLSLAIRHGPTKGVIGESYKAKPPPPVKPAGSDAETDRLWQNLLAAEWIVWSFYEAGVNAFNSSSFTEIGLPNTTYQRITDIRDNEAGHLRIFQNEISAGSVQPVACRYDFPFANDPTTFLALSTLIEVASMTFITGLTQQTKNATARGILAAIGQVETRHEVWSLLDVWAVSPFSGPSDTVFPYPNEILDVTNRFVVPGSCPPANPIFPNPSQHLPKAGVAAGTESVAVGATVQLNFTESDNQPHFAAAKQYYAVFFHAIEIVSLPLDANSWPAKPVNVTIPSQFSAEGVVIMAIADAEGAPTLDSVVAGPVIFLQQPAALGTQVI